jgi:hypothetical protein
VNIAEHFPVAVRLFFPDRHVCAFFGCGPAFFVARGEFVGPLFPPKIARVNMSKFALEGLTEGLYYELKAVEYRPPADRTGRTKRFGRPSLFFLSRVLQRLPRMS